MRAAGKTLKEDGLAPKTERAKDTCVRDCRKIVRARDRPSSTHISHLIPIVQYAAETCPASIV